jgi:[protein-PII] uridylyltransferase
MLEEPDFDIEPLMEMARKQIRTRINRELEFPVTIAIDNKSHPTYTLLQIQAPDRIALLYDLLTCLGTEGIAIVFSRISTQNGVAIDTFYVMDGVTRTKMTESNRLTALQKRLQTAAVHGLNP